MSEAISARAGKPGSGPAVVMGPEKEYNDCMDRKKELKKEYLRKGTQAGICKVECLENGRLMLASSTNAPGMLNSHKFQLLMNVHRNKGLQDDWNTFGEEKFAFEVIDTLNKKDDPAFDIREELKALETLWREKLAGTKQLYNP